MALVQKQQINVNYKDASKTPGFRVAQAELVWSERDPHAITLTVDHNASVPLTYVFDANDFIDAAARDGSSGNERVKMRRSGHNLVIVVFDQNNTIDIWVPLLGSAYSAGLTSFILDLRSIRPTADEIQMQAEKDLDQWLDSALKGE